MGRAGNGGGKVPASQSVTVCQRSVLTRVEKSGSMTSEQTTIDIPGKGPVSAVLAIPDRPENALRTGVVIAHGAGNDMHNGLIVSLGEGLAEAGHVTLRFNFPYKEKGKRSPDGQATLERTWQCVMDWFENNPRLALARIVAAGKSMGGRVAAQMAAAGRMDADALIFIGYPLHAPGRADRLRDDHLYDIKVPMLFFAGTRDPLCNLQKLHQVLERLEGPVDLETVDGGNHSFKLPASMPRPPVAVHRQIVDRCTTWISALSGEVRK